MPSLRTFMNMFITLDVTDSEASRRIPKYDLLEDFEEICKATETTDKKELFLRTGVFPFYRIFLTPEQQTKIIDESFCTGSDGPTWNVSRVKMISNVKYCPECMKEDKEKYGHFYLHRSHQLPGVTFCTYHHCGLEIYKGKELRELNETPATALLEQSEDRYLYASYCQALLDAAIEGSQEELKFALKRSLAERHLKDADNAYSTFTVQSEFKLSQKQFFKAFKQINTDQYLAIRILVPIIQWLYPDVTKLKSTIENLEPPIELQMALLENDCSLIGSYSPTIITIQHKCGHITNVHPNSFIAGWFCPNCGTPKRKKTFKKIPIKSRDEELFKREIQELTGSEYTLVSPYKDMRSKVQIQHNKCGHVNEYSPIHFLDGARCPHCTPFLGESRFRQFVSSISKGRYEVFARRSRILYTIRNTQTDDMVDLSMTKTIAEFERPTPSKILPMPDCKPKKANYDSTKIEKFESWLRIHYPPGEPIFLDAIDLTEVGMNYQILKMKMYDLSLKGVLKHPAPGVYFYANENFDVYQTTYFRYICQRGNYIGYPTGDNALYQLGIITNRPVDIRLSTNKESSNNKTGRTTKFMGHKLRIKGNKVVITNSNHNILMLLDTITNLKKYMKGQDTNEAINTIARYIKEKGILREEFSLYQTKYKFSEIAIRKIYHRIESKEV